MSETETRKPSPRDEAAAFYERTARTALKASLTPLDPMQAPDRIGLIRVQAFGDPGLPFLLHVPKHLDPFSNIGVRNPDGTSASFTFFDGRDLRRILLCLLRESGRDYDKAIVATREHLGRCEANRSGIAAAVAAVEGWIAEPGARVELDIGVEAVERQARG